MSSFLNFSFDRTAYLASMPTSNPSQKVYEFQSNIAGLSIQDPACFTRTIDGESTVDIVNSARPLTVDATTEFKIYRPFASENLIKMRWNGSGTHPGFRTLRNTAQDATTVVSFVRSSPTAMKLQCVTGTMMDFSSVVVGDDLYIDAAEDYYYPAFYQNNTGKLFRIIDKGSDYVMFRDDGLGADQSTIVLDTAFDKIRIFSNAGVKINDMIDFSQSCAFKDSNKEHRLIITGVTDREISFTNPYAIDEETAPGLDSFRIFDKLINFVAIEASSTVDVSFNGTDYISIAEIQPGQAFFAGSVAASAISVRNKLDTPVSVVFQTASLV